MPLLGFKTYLVALQNGLKRLLQVALLKANTRYYVKKREVWPLQEMSFSASENFSQMSKRPVSGLNGAENERSRVGFKRGKCKE